MKYPYTPEFEKFWDRYPRKTGCSKVKAFEAWTRALRYASIPIIMRGLERYPFSAEPQYQPHATTWINQHRWENGGEDKAPPTVVVPPTRPSRSSWRDKYDGGPEIPFQSFPEERERRMNASQPFTIDVHPDE